MKVVKVIAALVLLIGAGIAAYYSYATSFAAPPAHGTNGGPPAGIAMPKIGKAPAGQSK